MDRELIKLLCDIEHELTVTNGLNVNDGNPENSWKLDNLELLARLSKVLAPVR